MKATALKYDVHYPESDGKPLGETEIHRDEIVDLIRALQRHFREAPDVYVGGDMFLYYVEGEPSCVVCPDVFVARGVDKTVRRIYKLWDEGHPPFLVIEVTSPSTRAADLKSKKETYERLGVEEYFLHDPLNEYLRPSLQGFRLEEGRYRPIQPNPDGSLSSQTTGLTLRPEGQNLRLSETATGKPLLFIPEIEEKAERAEAEVRRQAERAAQAEERARELEEELASLRRERDSLG
jgi:Uma2 family endonuclease